MLNPPSIFWNGGFFCSQVLPHAALWHYTFADLPPDYQQA